MRLGQGQVHDGEGRGEGMVGMATGGQRSRVGEDMLRPSGHSPISASVATPGLRSLGASSAPLLAMEVRHLARPGDAQTGAGDRVQEVPRGWRDDPTTNNDAKASNRDSTGMWLSKRIFLQRGIFIHDLNGLSTDTSPQRTPTSLNTANR